MAGEKHSRRKANAELAERERRVRSLDIHPLDDTAQAKYAGEWTAIQERFVDQPEQAVAQAGILVTSVMKDRGYPTEGYDQTLADLSVEHANTLDHYRQAHEISLEAEGGTASTEDLRLAMQVIAGPDGYDPRTIVAKVQDYMGALARGVKGTKIAVMKQGFGHPTSDQTTDEKVRAAIAEFRALGAAVD